MGSTVVKILMPTFLEYLNARRVSAVSPDCEIRMHTSSLKERDFLNLRHPSPKAKANLTKVTMATNKNVEIRISPKDGCAAVKEVRGKINHHRKLCELLKNLPETKKHHLLSTFVPSPPGGDARVVGGAAADQQKTSTPPDFWHKGLDSAQDNTLCLEVDLGLFSVRLHIAHLLKF